MNYNSHPKMKYLYIGVDCHKYVHTACIINCFNEILETVTFNNDLKGFEHLILTVSKYSNDLIPIYGLEDTKHLGYSLGSYLLSKNLMVKDVNSNLSSNERKKYPVISKNDDIDSYCVAKVLLDELDTLPNVQSNELYWTLKQLVKMRKAFITSNIELKNKLHAQLLHHYPNYNKMFVNIDSVTSLSIFERYPSPNLIINEDFDTFVDFIKTSSKSKLGIKKANLILELIKEYNIPHQVYQTERNNIIKIIINQIKDNKKRIEDIDIQVIDLYDKIGATIHTYPCLDKISSAYLLSEIGNINRFNNSGKLARYAGIAPIEFSSGGKEKLLKNDYGNRMLNSYFYKLACRSLATTKDKETPLNSIFKEYYNKKINSGKTKHQAIICIMRRMVNIVYYLLKNNVEYKHPTELANDCNISYRERKLLEEEKINRKLEKKKQYSKNWTFTVKGQFFDTCSH